MADNGKAEMFDLSHKIALVTGAGQNVGAGIARGLARRGATVVVNDVVGERAEVLAAGIRETGARAVAQAFDVTDVKAVEAGIRAAEAALGGTIDILVNNAGRGGASGPIDMRPFVELGPETWNAPIAVNLFGVLNCTHAVLRGMIDKGWGRLITIASVAGTHGLDMGLGHYSAAKGGAISFTRQIAIENARHGITANAIALGLFAPENTPALNQLAASLPTRRRGYPEDAAALCVYLASPEASWFTGQTLQLSGGQTTT